jgi:hypothetical protein
MVFRFVSFLQVSMLCFLSRFPLFGFIPSATGCRFYDSKRKVCGMIGQCGYNYRFCC